jgi:hypothetical protein
MSETVFLKNNHKKWFEKNYLNIVFFDGQLSVQLNKKKKKLSKKADVHDSVSCRYLIASSNSIVLHLKGVCFARGLSGIKGNLQKQFVSPSAI